ncbi:thioesterase family protein [Pseudalkalibacillus berkeleyi]|uniref:Thioesterase family protein n=1 Tax=Pseudalkalibacillus berkeleyi TaxID=1069813 RepID=A0ABS9H3M0_9BACL|nr:thioesterase family protein [Pseudalkalibacillus berkeleyi]MCF6138442.1 thioesterase family protein [Pseudalkalibacillus berkeleyi]
MSEFKLQRCVSPDWVDYNGHMNDAEYSRVFSLAVDEFMDQIGLDYEGRQTLAYTIFTLESHICYLKEAHEGQQLTITCQILDLDKKRIHIFFNMLNDLDELIATSEQMLMGIGTTDGRPAPFPEQVSSVLADIYANDHEKETPKQAGRKIGIRKG